MSPALNLNLTGSSIGGDVSLILSQTAHDNDLCVFECLVFVGIGVDSTQ